MVDNAMGRLRWRRTPHPVAVGSPAWRGATAYGALAIAMVGGLLHYIPGPPRGGDASTSGGTVQTAAAFHQVVLPDLAVIEAGGISDASLARIGAIHGVRQTLALDGAKVTSGGAKVNVIGVNAQQFRSWTPLKTGSDQQLWTALDSGGFVAATSARHHLGLHKGDSYSFTGTGTVSLKFAGAAPLGVAGIDVVVSNQVSARLGLIHHVAALISAPGLSIKKLKHEGPRRARRRQRVADHAAPAARAAAGDDQPRPVRQAHQLHPALPGVRGAVLPGATVDRSRGHRADRER